MKLTTPTWCEATSLPTPPWFYDNDLLATEKPRISSSRNSTLSKAGTNHSWRVKVLATSTTRVQFWPSKQLNQPPRQLTKTQIFLKQNINESVRKSYQKASPNPEKMNPATPGHSREPIQKRGRVRNLIFSNYLCFWVSQSSRVLMYLRKRRLFCSFYIRRE